ncbi:MAG: hypothetical protein NE328_05750 [Lentisphaeraceae bacterium]|nr:hypothetical protein [Lentisphaeraceae bacterium]
MKCFVHTCSICIITILFLAGCCSERKLVEFEALDTKLRDPELNADLIDKTAPKPKLPPVWRGRKLFSSPWAYIYAKDKKSAEYVYDELEDITATEDKPNSFGLVIVTGSTDNETAFEYKKLITLYEEILDSEKLLEEEKVFFQNDLDGLNKITKFHNEVYQKADEKKNENELIKFRESIDRIVTYATFFIQPEIMEKYMGTPLDDSIYWCAFISVDDTIDENLDEIISAILNDYDVSMVGKGLVWGIISPGLYFKKRKVIKETQKHFEEGYLKNALQNQGEVNFSDKVLDSQPPAGVKGSE